MQREIPESVNIQAAHFAKEHGVKVILDMGGADTPLSTELLSLLDVISPNKTELKRILNKTVDVKNNENIIQATNEMRTISKNNDLCLLLKLGSSGCIFVDKSNQIYTQNAFNLSDMPIVDTTGAGINNFLKLK